MLVDFEFFLYESFGLEILHTCNQYRDGLMAKKLWPNFFLLFIFLRMSKFVVVKFFS